MFTVVLSGWCMGQPYRIQALDTILAHVTARSGVWAATENYSHSHASHADRYARAEEFVDVITGLWDSWEEDALVADKASGVWIDTNKMHVLNHKGAHFQVRGPLNAQRAPQGFPVIAQAGSVPELQRRRLFRTKHDYGTLRETLGLPRPGTAVPPAAPLRSHEQPPL